jgi:ectoine hydroxylase-related dioxygenase (phytanoyl-CoA dioxygenase family)
VTGFLRVNQEIAPYLAHPRIMALVDTLFGRYARISSLTGVINGPGIQRGAIHADWPYNQQHQSRIQAPYPDLIVNLVTMWMMSDFTCDNGGTIVVPGSHRRHVSPPGGGLDPSAVYEGEVQLVGRGGDVGVFDARTWHAIAPNVSDQERVAVIVRYAPWWLNLGPLRPGTQERRFIVERQKGTDSQVEWLPAAIHDRLPPDVQPLLYSMVEQV